MSDSLGQRTYCRCVLGLVTWDDRHYVSRQRSKDTHLHHSFDGVHAIGRLGTERLHVACHRKLDCKKNLTKNAAAGFAETTKAKQADPSVEITKRSDKHDKKSKGLEGRQQKKRHDN